VVLVDRDGTVIDGDKVIGICARFLKETGQLDNKEIVGTVMSNFGLEVYLKKHGMDLYRTQVGDRYIVERMRSSGSLFGGEPSGHLVFKRHSTTGDGILAALKVIECMKYFNKGLRELAQEVELYPQTLLNTTTSKKPPFEDVPAIVTAMKAVEAELKGSGRLLLRYSGTENLARVMVEGQDADLVARLCKQLTDVVAKELG